MKLRDAISDFMGYAGVEQGLSKRTLAGYASWLKHFLNWLIDSGYPDPDLAIFDTANLRRFLYTLSGRGYRPRTIRGVFAPLKALGEFLRFNGVIPTNPVTALTMPKRDAAERLTVSTKEIEQLLDAVERIHDERKRALSRAMLAVLIYAGLRAQEVLDLQVDHVNFDDKTLLVASGKGCKSRQLYPPEECIAAVSQWMEVREKDCKLPFLYMLDRGRRVGYASLCQTLEEVKSIAGLAGRPNIKCHSLRHAFATRMMEHGAPIKAIEAALGHSMAETTFRYLHLAEAQAKLMTDYASLRRGETASKECNSSAQSPKKSNFIVRRRSGQ